ncbi:MAG TPA: hypothetical protein PKE26_02140 [Kiritimatiellia bacterium]|nr:hypothetical protein [Kiritimatiellia bacterium]HMO97889.1 hypothetical protein [Kiritimatiellia bacterium]HMP95591.1 hypothetical protein [Kiritimatiellia bacterium]
MKQSDALKQHVNLNPPHELGWVNITPSLYVIPECCIVMEFMISCEDRTIDDAIHQRPEFRMWLKNLIIPEMSTMNARNLFVIFRFAPLASTEFHKAEGLLLQVAYDDLMRYREGLITDDDFTDKVNSKKLEASFTTYLNGIE